ncbi:ribose-5-phosphate isomerase RpiA [Methanoplanus sp. FWC-SCC4]|uniref:Ribose-5-phosphate isomerase A n=1 Tax=Methanochimaera problematica TaxID=2609417 RepID=A0AA97I4M0_9EURY|nr:ribose-5-phosphate isomerase RpiA [Methanoplanus sp. FWC-SCC4]WOF16501.1 ribose-5-phosphate isomerase RpiA [Methanoplanus sp. FWC-SCC4]
MSDDVVISKKNAGYYAADLVKDGMIIGLGTGSTVFYAMERLSVRIKEEGLNIKGVPTSFQTAMRARDYGIPLTTLDDYPKLDLAIDGADQIDPNLCMIKGRGAAQTRERCVAQAAEKFVVVADEGKLCDVLSAVVPVELIPFSFGLVVERLKELSGNPKVREGVKKDGPVITDNGCIEIDCDFGEIKDAKALQMEINNIPGVLSCGLFTEFGEKTVVVVGKTDGVKTL